MDEFIFGVQLEDIAFDLSCVAFSKDELAAFMAMDHSMCPS